MYAKLFFGFIGSLALIVSLSGCGDKNQPPSQAGTATSPVEYSTSIEPKDLLGNWIAGSGKGVFSARFAESNTDGSFKITNENGMISSGEISGATLTAPEWNLTGRLSKDKKTFIWSNGFIWTK